MSWSVEMVILMTCGRLGFVILKAGLFHSLEMVILMTRGKLGFVILKAGLCHGL